MNGLLLKTNEEDFPYWKGKIILRRSQSDPPFLEYKYVITESQAKTGVEKWENLPSNRKIDLRGITDISINDVFGNALQIVEKTSSQHLMEELKGESKDEDVITNSDSNSTFNKKHKRIIKETKNVIE